ncbi:MAG: pinensin family lanthipeptide [Bacteroidota bacterium]
MKSKKLKLADLKISSFITSGKEVSNKLTIKGGSNETFDTCTFANNCTVLSETHFNVGCGGGQSNQGHTCTLDFHDCNRPVTESPAECNADTNGPGCLY